MFLNTFFRRWHGFTRMVFEEQLFDNPSSGFSRKEMYIINLMRLRRGQKSLK